MASVDLKTVLASRVTESSPLDVNAVGGRPRKCPRSAHNWDNLANARGRPATGTTSQTILSCVCGRNRLRRHHRSVLSGDGRVLVKQPDQAEAGAKCVSNEAEDDFVFVLDCEKSFYLKRWAAFPWALGLLFEKLLNFSFKGVK